MSINTPVYTINWTDASLKSPFTIDPNTVDTANSSLSLTGAGLANWGEQLQENLIHLLENFASDGVAPANPTAGMIWYDANSNQLLFRTLVGAWEVLWPHPEC